MPSPRCWKYCMKNSLCWVYEVRWVYNACVFNPCMMFVSYTLKTNPTDLNITQGLTNVVVKINEWWSNSHTHTHTHTQTHAGTHTRTHTDTRTHTHTRRNTHTHWFLLHGEDTWVFHTRGDTQTLSLPHIHMHMHILFQMPTQNIADLHNV